MSSHHKRILAELEKESRAGQLVYVQTEYEHAAIEEAIAGLDAIAALTPQGDPEDGIIIDCSHVQPAPRGKVTDLRPAANTSTHAVNKKSQSVKEVQLPSGIDKGLSTSHKPKNVADPK